MPANAVGQIGIRRLTQPVRQQAGSYRLISTQPMHRVDRHASWPANAARVCGSSAESELTKIGAEMQIPVGAGLLANAVCQIGIRRLTQPVRQQAGSYGLIQPNRRTVPVGPASAGKSLVAVPQTPISNLDIQQRRAQRLAVGVQRQ